MQIARGYQTSTICSDGRIFTIGGSWNGPVGGKNGEIYNGVANTWTKLPGCPVAPMLTNDQQGVFRSDNHGWLFGWKNGAVFQAGPSSAMNWYGTTGSGSQTSAGKRASDPDSMNGNAVMFDALNGKILTVGGSPSYGPSTATSNAHIITIGSPNTMPTVQTIGSMNYARAFGNSVGKYNRAPFYMLVEVPFAHSPIPSLYSVAPSSFYVAKLLPLFLLKQARIGNY